MSVDLHERDGLAEVVLNRPARHNAIDADHFGQLNRTLDGAVSGGARALLLRGEGRTFSAGRDLTEIDPDDENPADVLRQTFNALVQKVASCPVPTIAAVQGPCLGAGLGIALSCDLVIAATDASFTSPFARLGAVPDSGFHWFLTSRIGPALTKDITLTGRALSGEEAAALGLVARAVPLDALLLTARDMAARIADGPTRAFGLSLSLIDRAAEGAGLAAVLDAEAVSQGEAFTTADLREGLAAHREKRAPRFRGR